MKSWEARRREARYWIMGLIVAVGVLLVFWAVVDGPQEWTKHQAVAAYLQTIILLGTAGIVWWYTEETRGLREAAQQQIEVQQRPFVIVPAFALGKALMFTPSPEISYTRYERDYGRFFSLIHETSHWMSVDRDFSKEIERRKQIVGPSPEGNKNKLQKGIMGSLFG